MIVTDKNRSFEPPKNGEFLGARAEGAYLKLSYFVHHENDLSASRTKVVIYLNDQGREVLRTED